MALSSVEFVDVPRLGSADWAAIIDGEPDPFETEHLGVTWAEKTCHVVARVEGRVIGHAGWLDSVVRTSNGQTVEVCGLGSVIVHRQYRGQGIGGRLVAWATDRMGQEGGTLGMLFCLPDRLPLYQSLGWRLVTDQVTVGQPVGTLVMPLRTCWIPLVPEADLVSGDLEVEGLPF